MKYKITTVSNIAITFILTLLGVSCGGQADAYGTPYASYSIKGSVKGVNNTKIEGIKVTIIDKNETNELETTQTDKSGKYLFNIETFPRDTAKFSLSFKDVDGEKNGSYLDKTTEVTILESELEGDTGGWNNGSVTKELNVQLDTKNSK